MGSRHTPDFAELIVRVSNALRSEDLPFMLIGGQAVLLHGQPRLTEDIDITLGVSPEALPTVLKACQVAQLEILPEDPASFVGETYVLPAVDQASAIRLDLIFSDLPYERQAIERAVMVDLSDVPIPFASAEDLILHKLFSGRPRDIEDVRGVIRLRGRALDWEYLEQWAEEFSTLPGREHLLDQVRKIKSEAGL
ncbi:nucleotidyl transferase AbiEii/AbiGii toxin family protein [Gemmatimonadota bacterium]